MSTKASFVSGVDDHVYQADVEAQIGVPLSKASENGQTEWILPPLPYDYNALEPVLDAETLHLHHDKHHAAYMKGLQAAEEKLKQAWESKDRTLVEYWTRKAASSKSVPRN